MNLSFKKYGPILLIAFSLICFGGAYFLNQEKVVSFSPITFSYTTQNYFGPIHVTQKNSTYKVVVKQSQTIQKSYVTIEAELLDETRKPFFGFSGELFYEQGIDRNANTQMAISMTWGQFSFKQLKEVERKALLHVLRKLSSDDKNVMVEIQNKIKSVQESCDPASSARYELPKYTSSVLANEVASAPGNGK